MPTSLTAHIYDGCSLADFIHACAAERFGNDEVDTRTHKATIDEYVRENVVDAQARLKEILGLSPEQVKERTDAYNTERRSDAEQHNANREVRLSKLTAMQQALSKWVPPSKAHTGLRKMMDDQINDTILWDCSEPQPIPEDLTPQQWYATMVECANSSLQNAIKNYEQSVKQVRETNEWLDLLRKSIAEIG